MFIGRFNVYPQPRQDIDLPAGSQILSVTLNKIEGHMVSIPQLIVCGNEKAKLEPRTILVYQEGIQIPNDEYPFMEYIGCVENQPYGVFYYFERTK